MGADSKVEEVNWARLPLNTWLVRAREPFLAYLRNLGSQVFLASFAWIYSEPLDFFRIDLSNAIPTAAFFGFFGIFLYAAYANTSIFLESLFPGVKKWLHFRESELMERGPGRRRRLVELAKLIFREHPSAALRYLVTIVVLQVILGMVLMASIIAFLNIYQFMHR